MPVQQRNDKLKLERRRHLTTRLLSDSRGLSVQEKEIMLESLLTGVKRERRSRRKWVIGAAAVVSAAAMLVAGLLYWNIWNTERSLQSDSEYSFTSRGQGTNVSYLAARCMSRNERRCRLGGKMAYKSHAPENKPYLAAFMQHKETETVVWIFPATDNEHSIRVSDADSHGFLQRATYLSLEFKTGQYVLYGVFSERPLTRKEVKKYFAEKGGTSSKEVNITESGVLIEEGP
jgi:hypothetical protein